MDANAQVTARQRWAGEAAIFGSGLLFAATALIVKGISNYYSGLFITLFRFVTGIALGAGWLWVSRTGFAVENKADVFWRGFYGALAMVFYFVSISLTGSGRATLLNTTYPLFVVAFGKLFFGESLSVRRLLSALVCMAGVVLVMGDRGQYALAGDLFGLASGVMGGLSLHYMKRARENNNSVMIYMATCVMGMPIALFSVNQVPALNLSGILIMTASGAIVFAAQVMFTYGMKYMSAARASILSFTKVPITILASFLLLSEKLTMWFLAGSVLILAGLFLESE
jgi:drug/metabolite transporter (DMT)-like permease